jgi:hypothetical protein
MGWVRHIERIGEKENSYRVLSGKSDERSLKEYLDIEGRVTLKLTSKKQNRVG